jgi:hypothetical protein
MIKIKDIIIPLTYDLKVLKDIVANRLNIELNRIDSLSITNRSVDTSNKQDIHFKMTVVVCVSGDENEIISQNRDKCITKETESFYIVPEKRSLKKR